MVSKISDDRYMVDNLSTNFALTNNTVVLHEFFYLVRYLTKSTYVTDDNIYYLSVYAQLTVTQSTKTLHL